MEGFIFHSPLAFLLLLALPFVFEGSLKEKILTPFGLLKKKKETTIPFSSIVSTKELPVSKRVKYYDKIINSMKALSFILLVTALARPQTGVSFSETLASGRDIMLVLDTSRSMAALDFQLERQKVERLTALKAVVGDFIRRREGDRIGLVVFGEEVFTQSPLTLDQGVLETFVKELEVGMAGDATALGDGIAIALKRMKDINSNSKVLVLVTDGLKTAGKIEPIDAAEIAKKIGVKIHSVGIGGKGKAPFRTTNIFGNNSVQYKSVPLDEKTLKEVSNITGGKYFNAINTKELLKVYEEIDLIEVREEKMLEYTDYSEHFWYLLLAGLILILSVEILKASYFKIFP